MFFYAQRIILKAAVWYECFVYVLYIYIFTFHNYAFEGIAMFQLL